MNKSIFQKLLPHLIAIVTFLVFALIFCQPALEGKVLQQHDIVGAKGMSQDAINHYNKYGNLPLWNTHLFSGMPNYQVLIKSPDVLISFIHVLSLGLPEPANFFFLACVCFYILCLAFRANPYVGIFGALAFAYATYNPVIISAGHSTKMAALCFAPALLAGLVWLYEKKYWIGIAVTALFAAAEVTANHPQINYYLLIAAGFMTISYLIRWIKNGEWKHTAIALSLAVLGAVLGVAAAAVTLFPTYEYAKYTMRGGKNIETSQTGGVVEKKTTGLDQDYAFMWSIAKSEVVTLFMPHAFGGSSSETFDEESKLVKELADKNIPENAAVQLASSLPKYWGGLESTSGPAYIGALSFLLFAIGLAILRSHHRWWILAAVVLGIFMAWGKYFSGFNSILFDVLPMYSKFRAPSMALVIPQLLVPLMAVLCLQKLLFQMDEEQLKNNFKPILYAAGGLVALAGFIYLVNDYGSPIDEQIIAAYSQQGGGDTGHMIVSSLKAARKSMFGSDIMRLIGFGLLLLGLLYFRMKKVLSPVVVAVVLLVANTIDLFAIGKKYLSEDVYVDKDAYTDLNFKLTAADQAILKDTDPHFRVYNLSPDRFSESRTSYYHRSLGGYHPAKLRIYQDLIETQFSKNSLNMPVLNMLDTRYFLIPDQQGSGSINIQKNDSAMGAAWFVKTLHPVNGPVEEIKALDNFDPKHTAFFDKTTQNITASQVAFDSTATIQLTHYNNDTIEYVTNAATPQFAVFSEIYYPAGWNAYIDGKKTDHYKVDYVLRGMPIPAGKHTITFRFEPQVYKTSYNLVFWGMIIVYILFFGGIIMSIRKKELQGYRKEELL
ncbi:YfhO family protein [Chitinophagaceae bacterium LB-8]|uniref:YfhO family protein n=1 Tax=Paraflavisolibacter caeni TaxID=2982496 RepID=A0A9X2XZE6_9BACT|nr:YfhO family protein [Paraflavisolibacter caeni]MCU7550353.1 YfhO family protein [Paraflavisolibacter caeni]